MPAKGKLFFGKEGKCAVLHKEVQEKKKSMHDSVGVKRQQSFKKSQKINDAQFQSEIFKMYDRNKDGTLQKNELKELMVDMSGTQVNDQDVDDLMAFCDKSKDGTIDKSELMFAVNVWNTYVQSIPEIEPLMNKYDADGTGKLDAAKLKNLLTDLNDGIAVEDHEVSWVLKNADSIGDGKIGRLELEQAIAVWFHHVEQSDGEQQGNEQKVSLQSDGEQQGNEQKVSLPGQSLEGRPVPPDRVSPEFSEKPPEPQLLESGVDDANQCKCGCNVM